MLAFNLPLSTPSLHSAGHPVNEELFVAAATGAGEDGDSPLSRSAVADKGQEEEEDPETTSERVRGLIEDCKRLLIPDPTTVVGAWGLIDSDPVTGSGCKFSEFYLGSSAHSKILIGDPRQTDVDIVFILTADSYYIARYEHETDKVNSCPTR